MKPLRTYFLRSVLLMVMTLASLAQAAAPNRAACLSELRQMKAHNQARIGEIESRLKILLSGSPGAAMGLSLAPSLPNVDQEIEGLSQQHREHVLRQNFLDRLMFEVDSHYKGGDLRQFLRVQLTGMAQTDLIDSSSPKRMWKFLSYLAQAIEDMPERDDNPLAFIEGYMKFSTISDPKKPEEFLKSQSYTNGKDVMAAQSVPRDQIGEAVEQKLQSIDASAN